MCFAASLALCAPVQGFPGQWFLGEHSPTSRQLHVKAKLGVSDCLRNVWPHAWTATLHVASAHPFACTQQVLSYSHTSESVCEPPRGRRGQSHLPDNLTGEPGKAANGSVFHLERLAAPPRGREPPSGVQSSGRSRFPRQDAGSPACLSPAPSQADLEDMTDLIEMREEMSNLVISAMKEAEEYQDSFERYSYLWTDDPQEFMKHFLVYGRAVAPEDLDHRAQEAVPKTLPNLAQFQQQVRVRASRGAGGLPGLDSNLGDVVFKCGFYHYSGLVPPSRARDCHGRELGTPRVQEEGAHHVPTGPRGMAQGRSRGRGTEGQRGRKAGSTARIVVSTGKEGPASGNPVGGLLGVGVAPRCLVPGPGGLGQGSWGAGSGLVCG